MGGITADRRLWVNADKTKLVEEGSEEAAHLLAGPGDLITGEFVHALKLELKDGKVVSAAQPEAAQPEAELPPAKRSRRPMSEE